MLMDTNGNTKELLIKDLSSRLPYKVIVDYAYNAFDVRNGNYVKHGSKCILTCSLLDIFMPPRQNEKGEYIKPYLFPLSSMTDEQEAEYNNLNGYEKGLFPHTEEALDYLIKNNFDVRGLIERKLAIDATGLNIY